jgi:hypothetical protein
MLEPKFVTDGIETLAWLGLIAVAGFLVSWVLTDVFHVGRALYVGVLAVVATGLTTGYLTWSDQGASFWTHHWAWGLLGALVTGAILARGVSRIPMAAHGPHHVVAGEGAWEGFVYGAAEGLLLSVLPVLVVWQLFASSNSTAGWRAVAAGSLALAASALVIVVHHLGYREFRNRRIVQPLIACLVLSLGYLLTGSPIAAIGGHIVLHLAMLRRGLELPPHHYAAPGSRAPVM